MNKDTEKQKLLGLLEYLYRNAYHCNGCASVKYSCEFCDEKNEIECNNAYHKLTNLIEKYFELEKYFKILEKNYDELYDFVHYPKPYKFEDLKPNMWVWDDKCEMVIKIENITGNVIYPYEDYFCDPCDVSHNLRFEFEENRFYPVTKAICEVNER